MKRNVAINGLGDEVVQSESSIARSTQAKVQVNEGDAWWDFLLILVHRHLLIFIVH